MAETLTKAEELLNAFAPLDDDGGHQQVAVLHRGQTGRSLSAGGQDRALQRRDTQAVLQRIKVLAQVAGDDFYYRFPVKKKVRNEKTGKTEFLQDFIEGPSIKCALCVAREYGNCVTDVRLEDNVDSWHMYARFDDLETGFSLTRAFQQRKNQKSIGTDDGGRAADIVFQIGQSKAIRNVIVNSLGTYTDFAFEEAKRSIIEKVGQNLEFFRNKVLTRLAEMHIDKARVELTVGRSATTWLAPDVARIIAEIQSIKDGMASAEDLYGASEEPVSDEKPERNGTPPKTAETQQSTGETPPTTTTTDGPANGDPNVDHEAHWRATMEKRQTDFYAAKSTKTEGEITLAFVDGMKGAQKRREVTPEVFTAIVTEWHARCAKKKG